MESVGIERVGGETIVVFKAKGKLTHDDYQSDDANSEYHTRRTRLI